MPAWRTGSRAEMNCWTGAAQSRRRLKCVMRCGALKLKRKFSGVAASKPSSILTEGRARKV